jgi:proline iminopeptidase
MMLDQEGFITLKPGLRLYYQAFGNMAETLIIPDACKLTKDLSPLAKECRIIFYDSRGRGQSDRDPDTSSLGQEYEVSDIESVRQHFGLETMALLGWSYLGGAAVRYAAQRPTRINRLILMSPISPRNPAPYDNPQVSELKEQSRIDSEELEQLKKRIASGEHLSDPQGFCREFMHVLTPRQMGRPAALQRMKSDPCIYPNEWWHNIREHNRLHFPPETRINYDWREQAASVSAPTLIIHGTEDLIPQESSIEWCSILPNARLFVIEGVGHYPHLEAPEVFYPAIEQFLRGNWPDKISR